jgi:hypothetical protein
VPRIDAIYVGPADLAFSLGKTPMLDSEDAEQLGMYEVLSGSRHKALGPDFFRFRHDRRREWSLSATGLFLRFTATPAQVGPGVRIRLAPAGSQ